MIPAPLPLDPPRTRHENPEFPFQGSLVYQGVQLDIENAAGTERKGVAEDGTPWSCTMAGHYGEARDTLGVDGDAVDVFCGPHPFAPFVWVVHSKFPGKQGYDEDKCVLGCESRAEALALFRASYSAPGFVHGVTRWPFGAWAAALQRPALQGQKLDEPLAKGGPVQFVIDLAKAMEQLSLFGRAMPPPTALGMHTKVVNVHGHTRETEHGIVSVAAHQRVVEVVAAPPPPPPNHPPESQRLREDDLAAVGRRVVEEANAAPTAPPEPTPAGPPPPPPASPPSPWPHGSIEDRHRLKPGEVIAHPPSGGPYFYAYGTHPGWLPPGATDHGADASGRHIVESPIALHHSDVAALSLEAVNADGSHRTYDPAEWGELQIHGTDETGENYAHDVPYDEAARRQVYAIVADRMSDFRAKVENMAKRARRLGLEEPTLTELGTTVRRLPVAVEGYGRDQRVIYGNIRCQLVHLDAPQLKIAGWTLQAVIKPLEGTDRTQISRIGNDTRQLPRKFWTSGMHCEHCGTDRNRSKVVALHNPTTDEWKQCGTDCLQDFTGRSASNLANAAEWLAHLDGDADEFGDMERLPRGAARNALHSVLAVTHAVVNDDGGYVSRAAAERANIQSTADRVRAILDGGRLHGREGPGRAEIVDDPANKVHAEMVHEWMQAIPETTDDNYLGNLYGIGQASHVDSRSLGTAVSAHAAFDRAQAAAAEAARPPAGHFGKPGDKFGANKLAKKDRDAGVTLHAPRRVKVVASIPFDNEYGGGVRHVMVDADGHTFKWKASGSPEAIAPTSEPERLRSGSLNLAASRIRPGAVYDLHGTIKDHSEFRGKKETNVTRATLHRVLQPSEEEYLHDQRTSIAEHRQAAAIAARQIHDQYNAQLEADIPGHEGPIDFHKHWNAWRKANASMFRSVPELDDTYGSPSPENVKGYEHDATRHDVVEEEAWAKLNARAAIRIRDPIEQEEPMLKAAHNPAVRFVIDIAQAGALVGLQKSEIHVHVAPHMAGGHQVAAYEYTREGGAADAPQAQHAPAPPRPDTPPHPRADLGNAPPPGTAPSKPEAGAPPAATPPAAAPPSSGKEFGDPELWSGKRQPTPAELQQAKETPPEEWKSKPLPEDLGKYFMHVPGAKVVQVSSLTPIRARDRGVANGNRFMWLSYWGAMEPRRPISLRDNGNGSFTVLDGNSTYANANMSHWTHVLGVVEEPAPHAAAAPPSQKTSDPEQLWAHAAEAHEHQIKALSGMGRVVRGDKGETNNLDPDSPDTVVKIGPMKKRDRAKAKADADYGGDHSRLLDITRSSVSVQHPDDVAKVEEKLRATGAKIVRRKDRFTNPGPGGYRELILHVEWPNGHIGEVQVHVHAMLAAKAAGHKLYDQSRKITDTAKREGRGLEPDEAARVKALEESMSHGYNAAWARARATPRTNA